MKSFKRAVFTCQALKACCQLGPWVWSQMWRWVHAVCTEGRHAQVHSKRRGGRGSAGATGWVQAYAGIRAGPLQPCGCLTKVMVMVEGLRDLTQWPLPHLSCVMQRELRTLPMHAAACMTACIGRMVSTPAYMPCCITKRRATCIISHHLILSHMEREPPVQRGAAQCAHRSMLHHPACHDPCNPNHPSASTTCRAHPPAHPLHTLHTRPSITGPHTPGATPAQLMPRCAPPPP